MAGTFEEVVRVIGQRYREQGTGEDLKQRALLRRDWEPKFTHLAVTSVSATDVSNDYEDFVFRAY